MKAGRCFGSKKTNAMSAPMRSRILAVEDLKEARVLLKHILQKQYDVEVVPGVDAALKVASEQTFHLFLLDINLGGDRNGMDLLHLLREKPQYQETPALAVTVHSMPWETKMFFDAGFTGFVTKPFRQKELLEAIEEALAAEE